MFSYKFSARVSMYATRLVMAAMAVLLVSFPMLVDSYHRNFRPLLSQERTALISGFYASSVAVLLALWSMDRLLRNILQEQLFTNENVVYIRVVRWCCLAVCLICFVCAFGLPALALLSIIMGFLFLAVTVVGQIMKAAVAIREENDLTV